MMPESIHKNKIAKISCPDIVLARGPFVRAASHTTHKNNHNTREYSTRVHSRPAATRCRLCKQKIHKNFQNAITFCIHIRFE